MVSASKSVRYAYLGFRFRHPFRLLSPQFYSLSIAQSLARHNVFIELGSTLSTVFVIGSTPQIRCQVVNSKGALEIMWFCFPLAIIGLGLLFHGNSSCKRQLYLARSLDSTDTFILDTEVGI